MNYLAHLYLAKDSDELIVGNFIGDFVKGKLRDQYIKPVMRGIILHRKIDSYTDSNSIFRQSKLLISRKRRKFAGVIIDIFFDHFLSLNWNEYSKIPLDDFIGQVCNALEKYRGILPPEAKKILPAIKERNWLGRYSSIKDLESVFKGISGRLSRENTLPGSEEELIVNYNNFERNFRIFFPQLVQYTEDVKKQI